MRRLYLYREEGGGEGENCGLTVIRLFILGKRARVRESTGG